MNMRRMNYTKLFQTFFLLLVTAYIPVSVSASGAAKSIKTSSQTVKTKNTFDSPDFSFPQTVTQNARKALDKALEENDQKVIVKALLEICCAESTISRESADKNVALIDSVSANLTGGWLAMAKMMEATLVAKVYENDRWVYGERHLPAGEVPESMTLWDKDMFRSRVESLIKESLAAAPGNASLADFNSLLTPNSAPAFRLTDFLYWKALSLMRDFEDFVEDNNVIPFMVIGTPQSEQTMKENFNESLIQGWKATLDPASSPERWAVFIDTKLNYLSTAEKGAYLHSLWTDWEGLPLRPLALRFLSPSYLREQVLNDPASPLTLRSFYDPKNIYDLLTRGLAGEFGKDSAVMRLTKGSMQNALDELSQSSVNYHMTKKILPNTQTDVELKMTNINAGYILIFDVSEFISPNRDYVESAKDLSRCPQVGAVPVKATGTIPFSATVRITLPALQPGRYCTAFSTTKSATDILARDRKHGFPDLSIFRITDLTSFSSETLEKRPEVYVVEGANGAPQPGLKVKLESPNSHVKYSSTVATDEAGAFQIPSVPSELYSLKYSAERDGCVLDGSIWGLSAQRAESPERVEHAKIFFDRSIARPGDRVGFAAVAYSSSGKEFRVLADKDIEFTLLNASGVKAGEMTLKTDSTGRCAGEIDIPEDGMLGTWRLRASLSSASGVRNDYASIRVEEYKNPTVRLILDKPVLTADSVLTLAGRVETYSGMAVPGSKVNLRIDTRFRPWFRTDVSGYFTADAVTGGDGRFKVELSLADVKDTAFGNASYLLNATATTEGGDVAFDGTDFSLSDQRYIEPAIPGRVKVEGEDLKFNVRVFNQAEEPVRTQVRYKLTNMDDPTKTLEGEFTSPLLELKSELLPSGAWKGFFSLSEESDSSTANSAAEMVSEAGKAEVSFTVWRTDDVTVPGEGTLWVPEQSLMAGEDSEKVSVRFGSRFVGQNILCMVCDSEKVLERRWIVSDGRMESIEVPAPDTDGKIFVLFTAVKDFNSVSETVTVLPASEMKKLTVKTESFRDKMVPTARESWTFRFYHGEGPVTESIPSLAVMTDKALSSLDPFVWSFSPRDSYRLYPAVRTDMTSVGRCYSRFSGPMNAVSVPLLLAKFPQEWIYSPFGNYGYIRIRGSRKMYNSAMRTEDAEEVLDMVAVRSAVIEEKEVHDEVYLAENEVTMAPKMAYGMADSGTGSLAEDAEVSEGADSGEEAYRESECPVAFFMPMLSSGADGELKIDFEVPDFNTTWEFQLLGYDKHMDTAKVMLEAVSTKPVMVSGSLPRFVRTGDKVVLTARAFNNSENKLPVGGEIVVKNPLDGEVLVSKRFDSEVLAPGEGRLLSVVFDVPYTLNVVEVLTSAQGPDNRDGERSLLTVLPASSPVIESTDFYLAPGEKNLEVSLPKMGRDSQVTLLYCDDPAWYALTALPAMIEEEGKTLTSLLYNYYGNAIGAGLISSRPELRRGLEEMTEAQKWGEGNMLTSNLERNANLKVVSLGSTPWVNSAEAETARMESLINLTDTVRNRSVLDRLLTDIKALQGSDGGMKWFPGAESSSEWCTGQMLLHFGMLNRFGYLPATPEVKALVSGGVRYCREEILKDWKEMVKRSGDKLETLSALLPTMTNFLYVTSLFGEPNPLDPSAMLPEESREFMNLAERSLKLLRRSWKPMGIYNKATAATLLYARGYEKDAEEILQSLTELAMSNPRKGMWYDNLEGGMFSPWNKLITTAQVLEAFAFVRPDAPQIEGLRQWLLLQRQAEDWGSMRDAAELVQAILSVTSDKPLSSHGNFRIKVEAKTVLESDGLPSYGEKVISLDPAEVSGKTLKIERNGNDIAWGAVTQQYVAPMKDIKAASIPDLSLEKSIFVVRTENGEQKSLTLQEAKELRVGDRIRVLLTVKCDRDLEYVTVTDERGACLEPAEALSGTDFVDGRLMYREVRNSETRFFLSYLPKGSYQFGYDCLLTSEGTFTAGIATIQSLYAPQLTAHSAALPLRVAPAR